MPRIAKTTLTGLMPGMGVGLFPAEREGRIRAEQGCRRRGHSRVRPAEQ